MFRNLHILLDYCRRESARAYLYERAEIYLRSRPQLAGHAFDRYFIDIAVDGGCDNELLEALFALVDVSGRNVLDVGANIGNHAIAFATKAGHVFAFEPHPVTFRLLELNLAGMANVTLFPIGASDRPAARRAVSPMHNYSASAITDRPLNECEREFTFSLVPLDSLPELRDIALIKLDVEGHELQALRGAAALIGREEPFIVFEQLRDGVRDGRSDCRDFLAGLGYIHLYSIDRVLPWRTPERLPRPIRSLLRGLEVLSLGMPRSAALLAPVAYLEQRDYPMLLAATAPLTTAGAGTRLIASGYQPFQG